MKQIEEQINSKLLLGAPPFFREFKINPFIYWFVPLNRLSFFSFEKKTACSLLKDIKRGQVLFFAFLKPEISWQVRKKNF